MPAGNPTAATLIRKQDPKGSARAATTAALPANTRTDNVLTADANGALPAIDGVTLVVADPKERVLVKNEAAGANNGIYDVTDVGGAGSKWVLTRSVDFDADEKVTSGAATFVSEGTVNAGREYTLITADPITVNTTALVFTQTGGTTPALHAASHADGGLDEAPIAGLAEAAAPSNDVSAALRPDGSGGVAFSDVAHADLTSVGTDDHHAQDHAARHTDSSDDIQNATAAQKGLATAAQITSLDILSNIEGFANGSFITNPRVLVTEAASIVSLDLDDGVGGDVTVQLNKVNRIFTVGSIALTNGSDISPQINFVWLAESGGVAILVKSTVSFPSTEHVPVAIVLVQSAAGVSADGPYKVHAWVDHVINPATAAENENMGHLSDLNERWRQLNAEWASGVSPTLTITPNGGTPDNVDIATTAGIVFQLHKHTMPARDTGVSDSVFVINDSVAAFVKRTDLNAILTDSAGGSMSGKFFTLVLIAVVNEVTGDCKLMLNLPSGSYNNASNLLADPDKFANFSIPADFKGVAALIAQINLRHQAAASGTWTEISTFDLRGLIPAATPGAAGIGPVEFADNAFRVFDDGDDTKKIAFEASGITAGTVRVITMPDKDITLDDIADTRTPAAHTHPTSDVVSGTFVDARISESSVTQHVGAIDHDSLLNYLIAQHRIINDAGTAVTELWSADKIGTEIAAAVVGLYDHKGAYDAATNTPDLDTTPSGIKTGDAYTVSVAGTFFTELVEVGDVLIADQDDPTVLADWTRVNKNIDAATTTHLADFDANDAIFPATDPAGASSRNGHPILTFDDTVAETVIFPGVMSRDYSAGNVLVDIDWVLPALTTGDVTWGVEFERVAPGGQDIDADGFDTQQTGVDTTAGTAGVVTRTTITLTQAEADDIAAGDAYRLRVQRLASGPAEDAQLLRVIVRQ